MRLLHTSTLQLSEFFNNIPDYAILSHTWGFEEVTFEDIGQVHAQEMAGFEKVLRCCERARQDGFEWAWIDTCCIQKTSSAELSEAINSMWKYYWRASVCYAHFSDVRAANNRDRESLRMSLKKSRWFSRGWTLQELVAPAVVEFYDADWVILGTKSSLVDFVSEAARIDRLVLIERSKIRKASVAQKIQWASRRETSREEDMAYCLLGLLNINMPLLYGEGKRAFHRLQMELMQTSNEHTLFAWNTPGSRYVSQGLLANSPAAFSESGSVRASKLEVPGFVMTNRGLVIHLPCITHPTASNQVVAILNCYFQQYSVRPQDGADSEEQQPGRVGILLETDGSGRYWRALSHPMLSVNYVDVQQAEWKELCVVAQGGPDREEDFNRIPYAVHIQPLPSFTRTFKIQRIAKSSPRFDKGKYMGMDGPYNLYTFSMFFRFDPDDFVGILFSESGSFNPSFFIAFGQRGYSMLWLDVRTGISAFEFGKALKRARFEAIIDADLHRDAADIVLGDGRMISVRAKKMRQHDIVGWQLLIDVQGGNLVRDVDEDNDTQMANT